MKVIIPHETIEQRIFIIRGHKIMIDRDLAELYDVEAKYLNRQVKRNKDRFPKEFMFKLTTNEKKELVTNWHRFASLKHSSTLPYVFTEHGVSMLATVLNSKRAVKMTVFIIKTFVKLGEFIATNKELSAKLKQLESKFDKHDKEIQLIIQAIRELVERKKIDNEPRKKVGFKYYDEK